eukprot:scaffold34606_cov192-Amphora_coffeaeformis.AAC.17
MKKSNITGRTEEPRPPPPPPHSLPYTTAANSGHSNALAMNANASTTTTFRTHRISPPAPSLGPPGMALAPPPPLFRPSIATAHNVAVVGSAPHLAFRNNTGRTVDSLSSSLSTPSTQIQQPWSHIPPPPPSTTKDSQQAYEHDPHHPSLFKESLSSLQDYDSDLFTELDSSCFDIEASSSSDNHNILMNDAALQQCRTSDLPFPSGDSVITSTAKQNESLVSQYHCVSFPDGHALAAAATITESNHRGDDTASLEQDDVRSMATSSSSDESSGLFPSRELDEMFDGDDDGGNTCFYYGL